MFPSFDLQQVNDGSPFSSNHSHMLGSVIVNVVTFRGYAGTCGQLEMVDLVRDESNPNKRHAIKVLKKGTVPLGYIEYSAAAVLSPLVDSNLIAIQGFAKRVWESGFAQSNNEFLVPCQVHVFATMTEFERVKLAIGRGGLIISESNAYSTLSQPVVVKKKTHAVEEKSVNELFTLLKLKLRKERTLAALEPPRSMIKSELFPHQKEGLGWLVNREKSYTLPPFWDEKNGVYVNELTKSQTYVRPEPIRGGIFADDMGLGKTLTLLALIANDKWTYSGRSSKEEQDEENNVLLGKMSDRGRGSEWVLKKKQKVEDHNVIMAGEPTFAFDKPCASLEPRTTLIVSPFVFSWVEQLEEHIIPGSFNVYIYYGGEQTIVAEELQKYDIVLTKYSTLALESTGSPILWIEWRRVILDEAHLIRNPKATQSCAVHNLKAKRRWAVSDTPIQKTIFELFSIMVFLKFEPLSNQQLWNSLIQHPFFQGDHTGIFRFQVLMESILLRRTKEKLS